MTKQIIYISGPISDVADGNFKEFALLQEKIEAMGHSVVNPHEVCQFITLSMYESKEAHWEACMRECLAHLAYCHKLVTMNNWEMSKEAKIEVASARGTGFIDVVHFITFLNPKNEAASK